MALAFLRFLLEVFHHVYKEMLRLACKSLSFLSLNSEEEDSPCVGHLFALEVALESDDAISRTHVRKARVLRRRALLRIIMKIVM